LELAAAMHAEHGTNEHALINIDRTQHFWGKSCVLVSFNKRKLAN